MLIKKQNKSINYTPYTDIEIQNNATYVFDTLIANNIEDFDTFFINPDFLNNLEKYNEYILKLSENN